MHYTPFLAAFLAAFLCIACSKSESPPSAPTEAQPEMAAEAEQAPAKANTEPSTPAPPSMAPTSIEIVTAGEPPRRALRWKFEKGSKETLEIRTESTFTGEAAKRVGLPVVYTVTVEATKAQANGTVRIAFEVADVAFPDASAEPEAAEALEKGAAPFKGQRGTYLLDSRGVVSAVEFEAKGSPNAYVEHILRQLLHRTMVPIPEEEIGQGGQWTVKRVVAQEGVVIEERTTVELTEIEGSRVKLALKINTSAQAAVRYDVKGTGAGTWDLDRLVPLSSKTESSTEPVNAGAEVPPHLDSVTVMTRK
jgi:hypothetical protein